MFAAAAANTVGHNKMSTVKFQPRCRYSLSLSLYYSRAPHPHGRRKPRVHPIRLQVDEQLADEGDTAEVNSTVFLLSHTPSHAPGLFVPSCLHHSFLQRSAKLSIAG